MPSVVKLLLEASDSGRRGPLAGLLVISQKLHPEVDILHLFGVRLELRLLLWRHEVEIFAVRWPGHRCDQVPHREMLVLKVHQANVLFSHGPALNGSVD